VLNNLTAERGSGETAPAADEGSESVETLLAWTAARNRRAFTALVRRCSPRLRGHLLARGVDASVAEEVTQEVMLVLWRKADQFDCRRGGANSWIFAIARRCFINRIRKERRPEIQPLDRACLSPTAVAGERTHGPEMLSDLRRGIAQLPPAQAQVITKVCEGHSLAEIARCEQLPLGTVKTRARLGLRRLRMLFRGPEQDCE
jgi:RNA polymerase sigma-70 factor (ECF subfamily)